jgi:hypothetical protein
MESRKNGYRFSGEWVTGIAENPHDEIKADPVGGVRESV